MFFDDDGGREALYAYLVSAAFRVAGASVTVLRGTSAALGVLGVVLIWLALRRYGRAAALAGAVWAAGSLWLIAVSRDGFRNVIVVPAGALALWTLLRWQERPTRVTAACAGAAMGLGLWTYQPLKLLPLLALLWILWIRRRDRARYALIRSTVPWCVGAYLVVAAPMIYTAIADFRNYFGRGAAVSLFNPSVGAPESFQVHVLRTLGMFLVTGDPNQRHNVDGLPLLGPLLCIPFAAGLWRAWSLRARPECSLLLAGLLVFLVPPLVATEGASPHFLRSLGLAPYIAGLVGVGCVQIAAAAVTVSARAAARGVVGATAAVLLMLGGVMSLRAYLDRPVSHRFDDFYFVGTQLAAAARGGPATVAVIDSYDAVDVRFLDAGALPTLVEPGQRLAHPGVYRLVVARSREDIAAATDTATAARARIVATDPSGRPTVWEVIP